MHFFVLQKCVTDCFGGCLYPLIVSSLQASHLGRNLRTKQLGVFAGKC